MDFEIHFLQDTYLNYLREQDEHVPLKGGRPWLWPVQIGNVSYAVPLTTKDGGSGHPGYFRCPGAEQSGLNLRYMVPAPVQALRPVDQLWQQISRELVYYQQSSGYITAEAQLIHDLSIQGKMVPGFSRHSCDFQKLETAYSQWQPGLQQTGHFLYPKSSKEVNEMAVSKDGKLRYTREQYEQAKYNSSALEYAQKQGYELIREGGGYYRMKEHDSMIFTPQGSWFWNSRGLHGGAIEFQLYYEGKTVPEAVLALCGELENSPPRREAAKPRYLVTAYHHLENGFDDKLDYNTLEEAESAARGYVGGTMESDGFRYEGAAVYDQLEHKYIRIYGDYPDETAHAQVNGKPTFRLPLRAKDNKRLFGYLCGTRQIGKDVVFDMLRQKVLYESVYRSRTGAEAHSACFVSYDLHGKPCGAYLRGVKTYGEPFKREVLGSDKQYGWRFRMNLDAAPQAVAVFEASIDAASYATMCRATGVQAGSGLELLALGGLDSKPLDNYLASHPEIRDVLLCLDNDEPGRTAAKAIQQRLTEQGYAVVDASAALGAYKDWNELLVAESQPDPPQQAEPAPEPDFEIEP